VEQLSSAGARARARSMIDEAIQHIYISIGIEIRDCIHQSSQSLSRVHPRVSYPPYGSLGTQLIITDIRPSHLHLTQVYHDVATDFPFLVVADNSI
jgi:hypothetical protein